MRARQTLVAFAIGIATALASHAMAAPPDPLQSAECTAARADLEAALAEPTPTRRDHPDRLALARKQAAAQCLGRTSGPAQRSGAPDPPIAVPAPVIDVPRSAQARPPLAPPPQPAIATPRTAVITTCDPAGCWDSNGQRLNSAGPLLLGPHGVCSAQAGQVSCP
jgi:hypothetical protein